MKLVKSDLLDMRFINQKYNLPEFDIEAVRRKTLQEPTWLQLGAGNIFRAFLGSSQQHLLNDGLTDTGIIVAEGYDYEIVDVLRQYDNLTVNVTLKESGAVEKEVIGSIVDYLKMDRSTPDFTKIQTIFKAPTLQLVSLTITEKGYSLTNARGEMPDDIRTDFENGPEETVSYLGKLTSLLLTRFNGGGHPLALVSMDNMSHNGEKLRNAICKFVDEWYERGFVTQNFVDYIKKGDKVSFPWSMIDKITPRPDQTIQEMLEETGLEDMVPYTTTKHTYVAPYVNGEETQYLIIEDDFPNGRPALEQAGIIFTSRDTVNAVETMKVTTCLNPLHTALAIYGCLLDYNSIHEEMRDTDLVKLINKLGYDEGLPVVKHPGIIEPKQFIDEVINIRLPNPFIPDTPQRIATDTSQKLGIRFGETIKAYLETGKDVHTLEAIPFVYAGWLRYLTGINDKGEAFNISPDPLAETLKPIFADYHLGELTLSAEVEELLKDDSIFGVDLYEVGLAEKVIALFQDMSTKPGAIREALKKLFK